ncbi:lipoprotein-releasing ABC transporter permease subunit [Paraglaciecola polaris]|uniref:lipoprotein-releasing ABC transporter permease subunit n=1 Tax=Paraglaciecola polaris TaxID=222814 RepID=UPI0030ECA252|tara:strand:+ start:2008 stop:3243 length:1236 start_codon:yes stop_codon:yes gene_type:complete
MKLIFQLAWRFRSSKQQNGYISFISASSTVGIALGCFVLILLLSVMNGFERELKDRLLSIIPHGELYAVGSDGIADWPQAIASFETDPRIESIQPYTKATGMLQKGKIMKAIELVGIDTQYAQNDGMLNSVPTGQWQAFSVDPKGVMLGAGAMKKLDIKVGDKVKLLLPQLSDDLSIRAPKTLWLNVLGVVNIGGELDNHIGYMHLKLASETLGITHGVQGLRFRYHDPFIAPIITREMGYGFSQEVYMSDWTRTQGHLYQDIQLVRVVVYITLILVIGVACFNIVSTLVMAVNEKQSEIAMLKTMGTTEGRIVLIFMLQGFINGLIGTLIGLACGVLMALNLSTVAQGVEQLTGIQFLSGDIYFIDFLPSQLKWHEVYVTGIIALSLTILATLYPAKKAAKVNPASVLGH